MAFFCLQVGEGWRLYDMVTRHFLATVSGDCKFMKTRRLQRMAYGVILYAAIHSIRRDLTRRTVTCHDMACSNEDRLKGGLGAICESQSLHLIV